MGEDDEEEEDTPCRPEQPDGNKERKEHRKQQAVPKLTIVAFTGHDVTQV